MVHSPLFVHGHEIFSVNGSSDVHSFDQFIPINNYYSNVSRGRPLSHCSLIGNSLINNLCG